MNRRNVFLLASIFIILFTGKLLFAADVPGLNLMTQMEEAISAVAETVGPSVVSISTQRTTRVNAYIRTFGDDVFDRFFQEFFYGEVPYREFKQVGLGSGVIIDPEGYILTNEHVVAGADVINVTLADGRQFPAVLKGADFRSDLAVIKIDESNLPHAKLGDSDKLKVGQWAVAIGNPFAFALSSPQPTLTWGVISALNRSLPRTAGRDRAFLDLIQTDAAINPGNSGGPLLNIRGEVIGINVAIVSTSGGSEGIGFAIPVNDARTIMDKLLKGEEVLYGWLGIRVQDLNHNLAQYFALSKTEGVLIVEVLKHSPAEQSGLQAEDIIMKFGEKKIVNVLDFLRLVAKTKAGDEVNLRVIRKGLTRTVKVKIGAQSQPEQMLLSSPPAALSSSAPQSMITPEEEKNREKVLADSWRGLKVARITDEFAKNFDVNVKQGVIVTRVDPGSSAERAGVKLKDIITQINTLTINDLNDYVKAIMGASGNALIRTNRGYLMIEE